MRTTMSTTTADVHRTIGTGTHGEHDPHHQHHFTTMEQQFDTSKIGMWLFLATEVLTVRRPVRRLRPDAAQVSAGVRRSPRAPDSAGRARTNTVVLLVSSLDHGDGRALRPAPTKARNALDVPVADHRLRLRLPVHQDVRVHHKFSEGLLPGHVLQPSRRSDRRAATATPRSSASTS